MLRIVERAMADPRLSEPTMVQPGVSQTRTEITKNRMGPNRARGGQAAAGGNVRFALLAAWRVGPAEAAAGGVHGVGSDRGRGLIWHGVEARAHTGNRGRVDTRGWCTRKSAQTQRVARAAKEANSPTKLLGHSARARHPSNKK